ncbi:hypothetical protein A7311_01075 [Paenibacillus polymyxa]|uniref:hypothetical protein n=1 Tax=Paenibacillus polymyxa TaxID=1406 RepID=UPI00083CE601|nr:hypothetical protein [Paenibacillus polymyxa]ODB56948.1 hypothetical protein A7311_01075 [Paenibacillus polymyxa]
MDKIQEIREALAAATPGPWIYNTDSVLKSVDEPICVMFNQQEYDFENAENNAYLIANAPDYISYLLQQIEIKDKALKWYAAIENYEIGNFTVDQNGELDEWESRVQQDAGEKARTALKGEDTP